MEETNIIYKNGELERIKVKASQWWSLHQNKEHYFNKEIFEFLKEYDLKPTTFNLNSLDMFNGIILTDLQIKNMGLK